MRKTRFSYQSIIATLTGLTVGCSPTVKNLRALTTLVPVDILSSLNTATPYAITGAPYFSAPLNGDSLTLGFSPDSKRVVFSTSATNWISGDTNGATDVVAVDLVSGTVFAVSSDASGTIGNGASSGAEIRKPFSSDSKKVLFNSSASNLVAGDTNGVSDCFMKNLETGEVTRVSTNHLGAQINGGGSRCFAFSPSDDNKVYFITFASTWGAAVDTNGKGDIIAKDLTTGNTVRVSTDSAGAESNAGGAYNTLYDISPDGNYILFISGSTNLVAGDTNGQDDLFMKDVSSGTEVGAVTRINVTTAGTENNAGSTQNGFFSPDGTRVIFQTAQVLHASDPGGFRDIYVRDLLGSTTTLVSRTETGTVLNQHTFWGIFLDNNNVVLMGFSALKTGDTNGFRDVMIKNLTTEAVTVASLTPAGAFVTDGDSYDPALSPDGQLLMYETLSEQIIPGDSNGVRDIVIYKMP